MADDIVTRLRLFGHHTMHEDGTIEDFEPNPLTAAAADEIIRLRAINESLRRQILDIDCDASR